MLRSFFLPYSPECVEGLFSEGRMQDLASLRVIPGDPAPSARPWGVWTGGKR